RLAEASDVVTYEFENIPAESLRQVASLRPVFPDPAVLHTCQHREREKQFLQSSGFPCPKFEVVASASDLGTALKKFSGKTRLKSSAFGYDGKGQLALEPGNDPETAWAQANIPRAILEEHVPFVRELSVLVARNAQGRSLAFPPLENRHTAGILERTVFPARLTDAVANDALALARRIADKLGLVGLLGVEMFELPEGKILVNELAPRVHNSGHLTVEACHTSQFEQQIRAVCGLPFGMVAPLCPAAMFNLLGDLWTKGEPDWSPVLALPGGVLHLYGKTQARPGRKMGHLTVRAPTPEDAIRLGTEALAPIRQSAGLPALAL
ncbi:MAG: 5-(carboxyamino)imidazole ribonucleotide synthase, partial [Verrucomicrobia bacterium]|nr:5-(carboxyamino)imidazole ribonucleotide synthase [Verrucomicrobiota bacterium]